MEVGIHNEQDRVTYACICSRERSGIDIQKSFHISECFGGAGPV